MFLSANPLSSKHLNIPQEIKAIKEVIRGSRNEDCISFCDEGAVNPTEFLTKIVDLSPDILHFSGHGKGTRGLVLEGYGAYSKTHELLENERLDHLFKTLNDIGCVILNACYSESQSKIISDYVPYVIGTDQKLPNIDALNFSKGFYLGLLNEGDLNFAFNVGISHVLIASQGKKSKDYFRIPKKIKSLFSAKPVGMIDENLKGEWLTPYLMKNNTKIMAESKIKDKLDSIRQVISKREFIKHELIQEEGEEARLQQLLLKTSKHAEIATWVKKEIKTFPEAIANKVMTPKELIKYKSYFVFEMGEYLNSIFNSLVAERTYMLDNPGIIRMTPADIYNKAFSEFEERVISETKEKFAPISVAFLTESVRYLSQQITA